MNDAAQGAHQWHGRLKPFLNSLWRVGLEPGPPPSPADDGMDEVQKAEWEQRRIEVERQAEEARRLKRARKAAAEVERRSQVHFICQSLTGCMRVMECDVP